MFQEKQFDISRISTTIRNCIFSYKCSKEWSDLELKDDSSDRIRYCDECKKLVYLVATEEELAYRVWERSCVAIPNELGVKIFRKEILKSSNKPLLGAIKIKN